MEPWINLHRASHPQEAYAGEGDSAGTDDPIDKQY